MTGPEGGSADRAVLSQRRITTPDGRDIAYVDMGPRDREAVVLLHSLGADHRMWLPQIAVLAEHRRVLAPDTRGHGASAGGGLPSVDAWVADIDHVLDDAGVHRAALVGVSLGGIQATAYAAAHRERVSALVVSDSFVELDPEVARRKIEQLTQQARDDGMRTLAESYVDDTFLSSDPPPGADHVREAIAGMEAEDYIAAVETCFGVHIAERLAGVRAPTLVLWGIHDHKTPRELSERIAGGIAGADFQDVPGAGHLANVDNPEEFTRRVERFLLCHVGSPQPHDEARDN